MLSCILLKRICFEKIPKYLFEQALSISMKSVGKEKLSESFCSQSTQANSTVRSECLALVHPMSNGGQEVIFFNG